MKRLVILLSVLSLLASSAMAEVIIIGTSGISLEMNEPFRAEGAHVIAVEEMSFAPSASQGKQLLSIRCYFKNLSMEPVELSEIASLSITFMDKFELPLTFDRYTHVRTPVDAAAPFPLEPLIEITGTWTAEIPDAIAAAGEGQLLLNLTLDTTDYTVQLR